MLNYVCVEDYEMKKILLICNDSNSVINFRKELIFALQNANYDVYVIAGDDEREMDINKLGVKFYSANFENRSLNPISFLKTKKYFRIIINKVKPDIVFTFQIKPNIIGCKVASKANVKKIFAMVEGVGDAFRNKTIKQKIIRFIVTKLYKKSLKNVNKVFFLNEENIKLFTEQKIINSNKIIHIPGIGIDTTSYNPTFKLSKNKNVVKLARLIKEKGIFEYCELARLVRKKDASINFYLFGKESEIKESDLKEYIDEGTIIYGGYSKDVASIINNARLMVSCSVYGEGFPRTILEAMALGRPFLGYDIVGNRDAVVNNITGYLFKPNDINALSDKIIKIIDDDDLLIKLGKNSRNICVEKYDSKIINDKIIKSLEN